MTIIRVIAIALLLACFGAQRANAQSYENERYHLSMQSPTDWLAMSDELIAQTNAQVSHVTGRGFIAGYALSETNTLVFPYMLLQFKPYTALPEQHQPKAQPDERGQLDLLFALVGAFRQRGPLPDNIDTPQFIDRFGNDHARLNRLEVEEGRFDFAGKIPHEVGQTPIRYHTHGVFGKDGIAIATVFTVEGYSGLTEVIQQDMRTLKFDEGYTMADLPEEAPEAAAAPTDTPADEPTDQAQADVQPSAAPGETEANQAGTDTAGEDDTNAAEAGTASEPEPENTATGHADSTALIIILSLLVVVLFAAALIAWFVAHQKAQQRRARLERRQAQASAQPQPKPRPASPITAESRGSTDHRTREKTR